MTPIVRIYETEERAQAARANVAELEIDQDLVFLGTPSPGREVEVVKGAARAGSVHGSHVPVCIQALRDGRWFVSVQAPFGVGDPVVRALASAGPMRGAQLPEYRPRNPTPLSDLLNLPVLTSGKSDVALAPSSFSLTGALLSENDPTPLSDVFRFPTLSRSKGPRKSSLGMPLLSDNAAPFSSTFRIPTLSKGPGKSSFGLPLLSKNATPLSSLLGLPVLTRRKRD